MKIYVMTSIVLVFVSVFANASSTDEYGEITSPYFMENGAVIFYHSAARVGTIPACAQSQSGRWVIDGSTEGGKIQVSGMLSAYAMGKSIRVIGNASCGIWDNTETVSYFIIE